MKTLLTLILVFASAGLATTSPAQATIRASATCEEADIQAQINVSAAIGDTVTVPSGACTWSAPVVISNKSITLIGSGIGNTVITDAATCTNCPGNGGLQVSGASATNFVDISGFTFIKSANHSSGGIIRIGGTINETGFRVHNIRIANDTSGSAGIVVFSSYGLIDHVTFDQTDGNGGPLNATAHNIEFWGEGSTNATGPIVNAGYQSWARPSSIGTENNLFIEDNTFYLQSSMAGGEILIDGFYGARFVIRHNTFINGHPGWHGTDSSGRSTVSAEVYGNEFINNSAVTIRALTIRGGTAMVYDNRFNGTKKTTNGFTMQYFRVSASNPISNWGVCNGTNLEVNGLVWTSNSATSATATSMMGGIRFNDANKEVLGAEGGSNNTYFDGGGAGGYPCRDQPGRGPGQVLAPLYAWNNTSDEGNTIPQFNTYDPYAQAALNNLVQANRDYYNNTPAPGYSAYTYPHPLQGVIPPCFP